MEPTTFYRAPSIVLAKLDQLFSILQEAKNKFEQIASTLKNKQVQQTVISLAQESRQYASELGSQIESLGGEPQKSYYEHELRGKACQAGEWKILDAEKDSLKICEMSEKSMMQAYREVLNEPFLLEGIRKMIRYQLNGIMCAFVQLRLLNASLRR